MHYISCRYIYTGHLLCWVRGRRKEFSRLQLLTEICTLTTCFSSLLTEPCERGFSQAGRATDQRWNRCISQTDNNYWRHYRAYRPLTRLICESKTNKSRGWVRERRTSVVSWLTNMGDMRCQCRSLYWVERMNGVRTDSNWRGGDGSLSLCQLKARWPSHFFIRLWGIFWIWQMRSEDLFIDKRSWLLFWKANFEWKGHAVNTITVAKLVT